MTRRGQPHVLACCVYCRKQLTVALSRERAEQGWVTVTRVHAHKCIARPYSVRLPSSLVDRILVLCIAVIVLAAGDDDDPGCLCTRFRPFGGLQ